MFFEIIIQRFNEKKFYDDGDDEDDYIFNCPALLYNDDLLLLSLITNFST